MNITGLRQDRYLITVSVDSSSLGVFDKLAGGDADSSEIKYRPGGQGDEINLGGPRTINNVTCTRLYDAVRDHDLARQLALRVGKARASVSKQPLDEDLNPYGTPQVYTGLLKKVNYPDSDSNGASASMFDIEISTVGIA